MFDDIWSLFLKSSIQAAVLILLVLAVQWLLGKRLTPRWRCAMWFLVAIRLALPVTLPAPFSIFNLLHFGHLAAPLTSIPRSPTSGAATNDRASQASPLQTAAPPSKFVPSSIFHLPSSASSWLPLIWVAGALSLGGYLAWTHYRISRRVTLRRPLIDAPAMTLLEDCKQMMRLRTPVTLVETPEVGSPAIFGFVRPRLLLPEGLLKAFSTDELRYVFLHELSHIKRGDVLFGWVMTVLQIAHWFNPLVWLACHRMRIDRELACDALALSYAEAKENQSYGRTIIKLLEGFGCSGWAPSLAGTVENRNHIKERISMIVKFQKTNRMQAMAVAVFAGLALIALTDAQRGTSVRAAETDSAQAASNETGPPKIIATSPAIGATDADPALTEISVTFDRDMQRGFSWTGGGPDYPPSAAGAKAHWTDQRTCVLPVKLEAAHYYRVGINSKSFQNFRSAKGVPVLPSAIYFTTQGASQDERLKTVLPVITSMSPANGEQSVSSTVTELRVTFNTPMGGGFSWCGGGPNYPDSPDGVKPRWTEDHLTCVLPVTLKPNWSYELYLNSPSHKNFQSAAGVPLEPVSYTFKTGP